MDSFTETKHTHDATQEMRREQKDRDLRHGACVLGTCQTCAEVETESRDRETDVETEIEIEEVVERAERRESKRGALLAVERLVDV